MDLLDILSIVCLGAVASLSLCTILRVLLLLENNKPYVERRYSDEDGVATEETELEFKKQSVWQKTLLGVCTAAGIVLTLTRAWEDVHRCGLSQRVLHCWAGRWLWASQYSYLTFFLIFLAAFRPFLCSNTG
jgi:hypothetical protein